jgi:hypothetical protein
MTGVNIFQLGKNIQSGLEEMDDWFASSWRCAGTGHEQHLVLWISSWVTKRHGNSWILHEVG